LKGELYLSPLIARDSVRGLVQNHAPLVDDDLRLTERQKQVLQLIAEGKQLKEVGDALNITARTAAFHKYRIMGVLNAHKDADLVRYALKQRMIAA
jgi:DNA-binding NarL/FixJ family response regulator